MIALQLIATSEDRNQPVTEIVVMLEDLLDGLTEMLDNQDKDLLDLPYADSIFAEHGALTFTISAKNSLKELYEEG